MAEEGFVRFIGVQRLEDLLATSTNIKVLDTRTPEEFSAEHIQHAINVRECFTYLIPDTTPAGIQDLQTYFLALFSKAGVSNDGDEIVVVYEDGMSTGFAQSCRTCFLLSYLGHERVFVLNGGLQGWKNAGKPVTTITAPPIPVTFNAKIKTQMMASRFDVLDILNGQSEYILLDDRDKDEWVGTSSSPYGIDFTPRKGRIPGARWIEWYEYMKRNDKSVWVMKEKKELQELLASNGITPDQKIICYCFKGSRASHTLLCLLECGFQNVRNYFGSWNEWSRDFSLPIDDTKL